MRWCRAALVFLLAGLTLSACSVPPESRVALSEPGEVAYDERLLGFWFSISGGGGGLNYLHITPAYDKTYLGILGVSADQSYSPLAAWNWSRAHASKIDGQTYYNVKRTAGAGFDYTAPGESPGFIIVRADVSKKDSLILSPWTLTHIDEGQVKFRRVNIKQRGEADAYHILDLPRAELVELIRVFGPAKMFSKKYIFRRMRLDPEQAKISPLNADQIESGIKNKNRQRKLPEEKAKARPLTDANQIEELSRRLKRLEEEANAPPNKTANPAERVTKIISDHFEIEPSNVQPNDNLARKYDAKDLDIIELFFAIEEAFGCTCKEVPSGSHCGEGVNQREPNTVTVKNYIEYAKNVCITPKSKIQ